jgi:hypothetical protein
MIGGLHGLHFYNSEAPHMMTKPSRVFWAIGLFGLIWNALGCYNFILQMDPGALAESPAAYQVVISSRSGWTTAAFLIAIFGGALGCVLMLLRRAIARPALFLSLIGVALTTGHALWAAAAVPAGWSVVISSAMSLAVAVAVAVGLVWYTHRKAGLDLLR